MATLTKPEETSELKSLISAANVNSKIDYESTEKLLENGKNKGITKLLITQHTGRIGYLGGVSIAVNSIIGPAILDLPFLYQKSGFIPTTFCIILVCTLMTLCCLQMTNIIRVKIPNNMNFQREIEYSEAFKLLSGSKFFIFTQVSYFLCMICQIIASIVDTAQVVDHSIALLVRETGSIGIQFDFSTYQENEIISTVYFKSNECSVDESSCDPFENETGFILSIGYILCGLLFLPLGLMNLKENTAWQIFSFTITIMTCLQFICFFIAYGHEHNSFYNTIIDYKNFENDNLSLWGESWYSLFGIILFDFTLVTAIPAWLYEKKVSVNPSTVILSSTFTTSFIYIAMGTLGAIALPNISQNMLSTMMAGSFGPWIQIGASLFAFVIIGLGVPLFSVLIRLNLTGSGLCHIKVANLLAVYLPWSISWLFYNGKAVEQLLSWGGILFTSICAFLAPLVLAFLAQLHGNDCLEQKVEVDHPIPVWLGFKLSPKAEKIGLAILLLVSIALVTFSIVGQSL